MKKPLFALLMAGMLASCSFGSIADAYANKRAFANEETSESQEEEEGNPFTLSDTVSYESPYGDYSVKEIHQAIIAGIKADEEAKAKQKEEDDAAFNQDLMRALSAGAGIGISLYTKDYSTITDSLKDLGGSVMKMMGYEEGGSFLNWNYRIFDAIQQLSKKLDAISTQISDMEENITNHINALSSSLQTNSNRILNAITDSETKTRYSQTLSLFQSAKSNWDSFISRAYVPMENKINNFITHYTQYFGDFLDRCYVGNGAQLTLYYNSKGGISLPRNGTDYDLSGERIVREVVVDVPLAQNAFDHYNENGGRSYQFIDIEMLMDYLESGMDATLAEDCIMQLRMLASQSYFSAASEVRDYFDTYLTFANYLSGQSMGGVDSTNMKPIDVYESLLSSVYNFGFETEDEMTAVVSKLGRTFYSASIICDTANIFARTDTYDSSLKKANAAVIKELTLEGRVHPNRGRKFYCLDLDTYAEFQDHELLLETYFQANNRSDRGDGITAENPENPDYQVVENSTKVLLDGNEINLASLQENSLTLADFLLMKIKYSTNIAPLYPEAPSFGSYLVAKGVINDPTKEVVFSLGEILAGELTPSNDPNYSLYALGHRQSDNYAGGRFALYSQLTDGNSLNSVTKIAVTGQAADFDTPIQNYRNYILGTGFSYTYQDGWTSLDMYGSHRDYVPKDGDVSSFVFVGGHKDNVIHNENGFSLSFHAFDLADVYLLMKVSE